MTPSYQHSPPAAVSFDSHAIARPRLFGIGVFPQRDRREKPTGYTVADLEFVMGACPASAMHPGEAYGAFLADTLSPIQFNALMDELARQAAEADAISGHEFGKAVG